jgi:hypothetical protein
VRFGAVAVTAAMLFVNGWAHPLAVLAGYSALPVMVDRAGPAAGQGERLVDVIEHPPIFHLPGIPDHVTYTWITIVLLAVLAFIASRNVQLVPRGMQNFFEVVLEQFQQMIDDVIGPQAGRTCRSSPRSGCSSS